MKFLYLVVLFIAQVACAQDGNIPATLKGSYLFQSCQADIRVQDSPNRSPADTTAALVCVNYIQGFIDAGTLSSKFCTEDATVATITRIYVAYMQKNPKLLDYRETIGLFLSLTDAFPCLTKTKS